MTNPLGHHPTLKVTGGGFKALQSMSGNLQLLGKHSGSSSVFLGTRGHRVTQQHKANLWGLGVELPEKKRDERKCGRTFSLSEDSRV